MANEFRLNYTGAQINEKLEKIDKLTAADVGAIPNVQTTEEDEGAFLRFINGKWVAVKLQNAEEGEF